MKMPVSLNFQESRKMNKAFIKEILSFIDANEGCHDSDLQTFFGARSPSVLDAISDLKDEGLVHALVRPNRMSRAPRILAVANVRLTFNGKEKLDSM